MTTDPFSEGHAITVQSARGRSRYGAWRRAPNDRRQTWPPMAGFLTTDRKYPPCSCGGAAGIRKGHVQPITVDGECSTNDCLIALESGASGVVIDEQAYPALVEGFLACGRATSPSASFARREGATKLIAVTVRDARTEADARQWHASSPSRRGETAVLVRTQLGTNRLRSGRSGVVFDMGRPSVRVGEVLLFDKGLRMTKRHRVRPNTRAEERRNRCHARTAAARPPRSGPAISERRVRANHGAVPT